VKQLFNHCCPDEWWINKKLLLAAAQDLCFMDIQKAVQILYTFMMQSSYRLGLPYIRFFPDMSGTSVAKYASGRNVKKCLNVREFGIMHLMKSNRNNFTVRII